MNLSKAWNAELEAASFFFAVYNPIQEVCKGNVILFSAKSSLILDKVQSEPYTIGLFIIFSTPAHILR